MILILKRFSLVTIALVLASCSAMRGANQDTQVIHERPGIDVVLVPESYVATYFTSEHHGERHCRAPDPDVTSSSGDSLNLSDIAGDSIGFSDEIKSSELSGRTPGLLLTRELMYRACEMTSNLNTDKEMTIAIYKTFLKAITDISTTQM
jgi:predicted small secreted protein